MNSRVVVHEDGSKSWLLIMDPETESRMGSLHHREDGPSVIYSDGYMVWGLFGMVVSEEDVLTYAIKAGNKEAIRSLIWRTWNR